MRLTFLYIYGYVDLWTILRSITWTGLLLYYFSSREDVKLLEEVFYLRSSNSEGLIGALIVLVQAYFAFFPSEGQLVPFSPYNGSPEWWYTLVRG